MFCVKFMPIMASKAMMVSVCLIVFVTALTMAMAANLPETLEDISEVNSVCFGTHNQFRPSCAASGDTVIAVNAVKLGNKLTSVGCPTIVANDDTYNATCCQPDVDNNDCIINYEYDTSGISYKLHTQCSGENVCTSVAAAVNDLSGTDCPYDPADYNLTTGYMFMEFACVPTSRIYSMNTSGTFTGDGQPVYLQTYGYPSASSPAQYEVTWSISSNGGTINVYTVDVRLATEDGACQQSVHVSDSTTSVVWDCDHQTIFNITNTVLTSPVQLTFTSNTTNATGYVWIGFEGGILSGNVVETTSTTASTTTDVTSTTSTNVTPSSTTAEADTSTGSTSTTASTTSTSSDTSSQASTNTDDSSSTASITNHDTSSGGSSTSVNESPTVQPKPHPESNVGLIVGLVLGSLALLLAIAACIILLYIRVWRRDKKKVNPDEDTVTEKTDDETDDEEDTADEDSDEKANI